MKKNREYRIVRTCTTDGTLDYYKVYVHKLFWWFEATMHGYGNMFSKPEDAEHYIKMHSGEIKEYTNTIVKEYHSCQHKEKYRFIDRDGNLRCSDCHKVI